MKKCELVVFDWAGTTVDYGCIAPVQAFVEVFKHFGIEPTMEEVRKPMGMLKRDHIKTMLAMPRIQELWNKKYGKASEEKDIDALYQLFEEKLMSILTDFSDPKPFVLETMAQLRAKGIHIGSTTGYTDEMMAIVTEKAAQLGYTPDAWFSPNAVHNLGRPYTYMVYRNMEQFQVHFAEHVIKVGDTVSDIKEGKNAGVYTVGIVEGSSEMGLTEEEYRNLTAEEKEAAVEKVKARYVEAGADAVLMNMSQLVPLIEAVFE